MWYVVHLLFAQDADPGSRNSICETCQVLFEAAEAEAAYAKGQQWAAEHARDSRFRLVGIEHIKSLDEEPGDGCEVGGSFFEKEDVWQRVSELIPSKDELSIIKWERNPNTPIGELMTDPQKEALKELTKKIL
jgi:hypothetical protein